MTDMPYQKDLVILVADRNMEYTVKGLLSRPQAIQMREIEFDLYVHPQHDNGCLCHSPELLRSHINRYRYALVLFDRDGCGQEGRSRAEIENGVEARLSQLGWASRAAAIVIDPELEAWVWSDSPHVVSVLGWSGRQPELKDWLHSKGFLQVNQYKPDDPKRALEEALRVAQKPRSSSIFKELSEKVSFERCTDKAFAKFISTLRNWFPHH